MSRRTSDSLQSQHYKMVWDWFDCSRFHRNSSGYRLIVTKGWNLYVVNEADNLMYFYDTEPWEEWIRRIDTTLEEIFVYSDRYSPCPLLSKVGTPLTRETFLKGIWRPV
jgi:hypothetical protein